MMNVTILDGGMGRELKRIGAPFRQPEWSALALMETPDMVAQAHQNFIDAGAQIITTNTYALVPFHIGQDAFETRGFDLAEKAAKIARDCATQNKVRVAGCIPPAFGSYKPELFLPDLVEPILTPLVSAQAPFVDFWLIETMSSLNEALTTIAMIRPLSDLPIWLSFTLSNREDLTTPVTLRSGEMIAGIDPIFDQVEAVLFNCSQPEEMKDAIRQTRQMNPDIPLGAYANNFSEIKRSHSANESLSEERNDITPESYLNFAQSWVDEGATLIGGCCGITPDHIRVLSGHFK